MELRSIRALFLRSNEVARTRKWSEMELRGSCPKLPHLVRVTGTGQQKTSVTGTRAHEKPSSCPFFLCFIPVTPYRAAVFSVTGTKNKPEPPPSPIFLRPSPSSNPSSPFLRLRRRPVTESFTNLHATVFISVRSLLQIQNRVTPPPCFIFAVFFIIKPPASLHSNRESSIPPLFQTCATISFNLLLLSRVTVEALSSTKISPFFSFREAVPPHIRHLRGSVFAGDPAQKYNISVLLCVAGSPRSRRNSRKQAGNCIRERDPIEDPSDPAPNAKIRVFPPGPTNSCHVIS